MKPISIYEFDALVPTGGGAVGVDGVHVVPPTVFAWLEAEALRIADLGEGSWIRLSQRKGSRAVQVTSFVGVIRAPDGYQISYLDGTGDVVLIYPRTDAFDDPLPVFVFPKSSGMRLWVLPFCLKERRLKLPVFPQLESIFVGKNSNATQVESFNAVPA